MGLFSGGTIVGTYVLEFSSLESVAVTDGIPNGGDSSSGFVTTPFFMSFAFAYMAKMLGNMPLSQSQAVISRAQESIAAKINDLDAGPYSSELNAAFDQGALPILCDGYSMLGTFHSGPLRIVKAPVNPLWIYSAELRDMGQGRLIATTKIARGYEDELHRAAIDTVLETSRLRCGEKGMAVLLSTHAFLKNIALHGIGDVGGNTRRAGFISMAAASMLQTGRLEP
jgi:hypothetical protein